MRKSTASGTLRYLLTCWKLNAAGAMEFRLSFFLTAGMMFINNCIWLVFWGIFFTKFPVVNGWELRDVMLMWAVAAGGFGWANMLFGNFTRVAAITAAGQLDVYLTQPKPVLLSVLASRMSLMAIGDFMFGWVIYGLVGDHSLRGLALFMLGLLISGLLIMFFTLVANSLAFYIGNAEGLAFQVFNGFLALTTYPTDIFRGGVRIILFTLVPAGFISYIPIGLLGGIQDSFLIGALGITALVAGIGIAFFYHGLRRYTSGNQLGIRS
ncbi:ABC transporter permease [Paenibacillus abyssi]|nr:ABC-2 family transporter protein [Paenibacillus abyssi]